LNFQTRLSDLPLAARWLLTLALASFALNHLFAGWLVFEVTRNVDPSAKEHFAYKTLATLLRMAHQHTFGHGVMFFITGGIFLFAGFGLGTTLALVTLPFLGAWLDLASWFLLKYGSERWEALSMASGAAYSLAFAAMFSGSLWRMWAPGPRAGPAGPRGPGGP